MDICDSRAAFAAENSESVSVTLAPEDNSNSLEISDTENKWERI